MATNVDIRSVQLIGKDELVKALLRDVKEVDLKHLTSCNNWLRLGYFSSFDHITQDFLQIQTLSNLYMIASNHFAHSLIQQFTEQQITCCEENVIILDIISFGEGVDEQGDRNLLIFMLTDHSCNKISMIKQKIWWDQVFCSRLSDLQRFQMGMRPTIYSGNFWDILVLLGDNSVPKGLQIRSNRVPQGLLIASAFLAVMPWCKSNITNHAKIEEYSAKSTVVDEMKKSLTHTEIQKLWMIRTGMFVLGGANADINRMATLLQLTMKKASHVDISLADIKSELTKIAWKHQSMPKYLRQIIGCCLAIDKEGTYDPLVKRQNLQPVSYFQNRYNLSSWSTALFETARTHYENFHGVSALFALKAYDMVNDRFPAGESHFFEGEGRNLLKIREILNDSPYHSCVADTPEYLLSSQFPLYIMICCNWMIENVSPKAKRKIQILADRMTKHLYMSRYCGQATTLQILGQTPIKKAEDIAFVYAHDTIKSVEMGMRSHQPNLAKEVKDIMLEKYPSSPWVVNYMNTKE